jgi:hypothetical protein
MRAIALLLYAAVGWAMWMHATPADAQASPAARARVPVTVAILPRLDTAATPYVIARFGGSAPRDVILLASTADSLVLTAAVQALVTIRRQTGDLAVETGRYRVQGTHPRRALPWAARVVADARTGAPRMIPNYGRLRSVQIWLPASNRGSR